MKDIIPLPVLAALSVPLIGGFIALAVVATKTKPTSVLEYKLFEAHVNCMRAAKLLEGDWSFDVDAPGKEYGCKLWDKKHNVVAIYSAQEITTIGNFLSGMGLVK